jgi:hypothetical protein
MEQLTRLIGCTRRTDVSIYANGRIELSSFVAKQLDIAPGDVVEVATDGREYYLYVAVRNPGCRHVAQCRPTNRGGRHYRFHSVKLARVLLDVIGSSDEAHLPVGSLVTLSGTSALTLITRLNPTNVCPL